MGTPFEDFVNDNLGVRLPLFIDTTTPTLSSKAAGSLGSKFIDSTTNFLYEKTGYTAADWVKIAELGEPRGGAGGGMSYSNFTGGWNIEISGDSSLMFIETSKSLSGSGYFFDASGIIGTGDSMPFVVSESGQVGLNIYTGEDQATGYVTPYHLHVSGVTALSGNSDLEFSTKPTLSVMADHPLSETALYVTQGTARFDNLSYFGDDSSKTYSVFFGPNGEDSRTVISSGITLGSFTTAERDALSQSEGAILYNSTTDEFNFYQAGEWVVLGSGSTSGSSFTGDLISMSGCTLYASGEQVGINTCEPSAGYSLHVSGDTLASGNLDVEGNLVLEGNINSASQKVGQHFSAVVSSNMVSGNVVTGNIGRMGLGGLVMSGPLAQHGTATFYNSVTLSDSLSVTDDLPENSGVFHVQTGVYLPNLTDSQRDNLDLYREGSGALIFNGQHQEFQVHDGTQWHKLLTGAVST